MARNPDSKRNQSDRLVSRNRRATFDYEVEEKVEAGIVLIGSEVRSMRDRASDLTDAWVDISARSEAWVRGMRIPMMQHAAFSHEEKRPRKLLLHAEQIKDLKTRVESDGMTLIVLSCYFKAGRCKLEIAVARGKKKHDKRNSLREKEADREAQVAMRRAR